MICSKYEVTQEELAGIPVVRKEIFGGRWYGVSHGDLLNAIMAAGMKRRYRISYSHGAVSKKDRGDVALVFNVKKPTLEPYRIGEWKYQIGVTSSNSRRSRMRFFVGGWNLVLDRGFVSEELLFPGRDTRHTHALQRSLGKILDLVFLELPDAFQRFGTVIEDLRGREVTIREFERIIHHAAKVQASRKGAIPWSRIGRLVTMWRSKRVFNDLEVPEDNTAWRLMMAASACIKRNPPMRQMHDLNVFRKLLPTVHMERLKLD